MKADLLVTGISQLVTAHGPGPKHGAHMRDLRITDHAALAITNGVIAWVGPASEWSGEAASNLSLDHRAVVPGLIDPHTHAIWAGNRLADFDARTSGVTYEQILAGGGEGADGAEHGEFGGGSESVAGFYFDDGGARAKERVDAGLGEGG